MDENNCLSFTKPWYRNALKFPYSWYYPNAYEREAKHKIYTLYSHLDTDNDIMTEVKQFKFFFNTLLIICIYLGLYRGYKMYERFGKSAGQ